MPYMAYQCNICHYNCLLYLSIFESFNKLIISSENTIVRNKLYLLGAGKKNLKLLLSQLFILLSKLLPMSLKKNYNIWKCV